MGHRYRGVTALEAHLDTALCPTVILTSLNHLTALL